MKISRKQLAEATLALIDKGESVDKVAQQLASYLIEERRTRELNSVIREIELLRYERDGFLEPDVVSAHDLSDSVKQRIKDLLEAKHIMLNLIKSPEVVGGLRVRTLDKQIDLTIASKLKHLKRMKVNPA